MDNAIEKALFFINAGLGDACEAIPVLLAASHELPHLQVEAVFSMRSAKQFTQCILPNINGVVISELNSARKRICQIYKWRKSHFDFFVSGAHPDSSKTAILAYLVGAKRSIGMQDEKNGCFYDLRLARNNAGNKYADYVTLFQGIGGKLDIEFGRKQFRRKLRDLSVNHPVNVAGIPPGVRKIAFANGADSNVRGRWDPSLKRIPGNGLKRLFRKMKREFPGAYLLLGVKEDTFPNEICADPLVSDLRGKTSIMGLISILHEIDLLICNDTGTMHLAHYCGTPYLGIFGPTDLQKYAPGGSTSNLMQASGSCARCQPNPTCREILQGPRCVGRG